MDHFRTPHWTWWTLILTGMGLIAWLAFSESGFALWRDFITPSIPQAVFQWIFWNAIGAHLAEALWAWQIARRRDAVHAAFWGLQTLLLGYPSLRLLKALPESR